MLRLSTFMIAAGLSLVALADRSVAFTGGATFEFTGIGGAIPDYDDGIAVFSATPSSSIGNIKTLELEIDGITHVAPGDLDIYLISPFGGDFIDVMTDRGGGSMTPVQNVDLIFNNASTASPGTPLVTGTYRPDGLADGDDDGFGEFLGRSPGLGSWLLLVSDDTAGGTGSIRSFTLRGTVPEPTTISLLAIGVVGLLRVRGRRSIR